jgi:hypothetical protein
VNELDGGPGHFPSSYLAAAKLPEAAPLFEEFLRAVAVQIHRPTALCAAALELLLPFLDDRENPRRRKLRLIGVRAEKLSR